MKKVILSVLTSFALILGVSQQAHAANPSTLSKQLTKMLGTPNLSKYDVEEIKFKVVFTVNQEDEIIVLNTTNPEMDEFVKTRLNYQILSDVTLEPNKRYILPVTFVKK